MTIISFAKTVEPLIQGRKSVTRREWTPEYGSKFRKGHICQAYDRSPRNGGHRIGFIRITREPYQEILYDMPDSHLEREGGLWKRKQDFWCEFEGGASAIVWVVEFEWLGAELPAAKEPALF